MKSMADKLFPAISVFLIFLSTSLVGAQEPLTGSEIKKLLVGNTETGTYAYEGEISTYSEFIDPSGEIRGKDRWSEYTGTWELRGDCVYLDYEGEDFDGCYAYAKHQDGTLYNKHENETEWKKISVLKGNPKGL